jgi:hypothetical protein
LYRLQQCIPSFCTGHLFHGTRATLHEPLKCSNTDRATPQSGYFEGPINAGSKTATFTRSMSTIDAPFCLNKLLQTPPISDRATHAPRRRRLDSPRPPAASTSGAAAVRFSGFGPAHNVTGDYWGAAAGKWLGLRCVLVTNGSCFLSVAFYQCCLKSCE